MKHQIEQHDILIGFIYLFFSNGRIEQIPLSISMTASHGHDDYTCQIK